MIDDAEIYQLASEALDRARNAGTGAAAPRALVFLKALDAVYSEQGSAQADVTRAFLELTITLIDASQKGDYEKASDAIANFLVKQGVLPCS